MSSCFERLDPRVVVAAEELKGADDSKAPKTTVGVVSLDRNRERPFHRLPDFGYDSARVEGRARERELQVHFHRAVAGSRLTKRDGRALEVRAAFVRE